MNILDRRHHLRFLLLQAAAVALLAAPSVHAADGTWNVNASGTWGTTTNWLDDIIASGSGSTAYFTRDITADRTVTLDGPRTLTNVVFGDSDTATAGSWTISSSSTANTLTLAGTTPTITVNALGTGATATISANVTGTNGLTKDGVGTLVINKGAGGQPASFPNGALTVNGGTLRVNNTQAQQNANVVTLSSLTTINNGSTLIFSRSGAEGRVVFLGGIEFGVSGGNTLVNANSGTTSNIDVLIAQSATNNFTTLGGTKNFINSTNGAALSMQNVTFNRIIDFNVADGTDATDLEVNIAVIRGGIRKSGPGVLAMTRANTEVNYLDITAGTLELAGAGRLNSTATDDGIFTASFVNNGTLLYAGTNAQTLSGSISGSGSLTKSGSATLTLSGTNTYGGPTTVSVGRLQAEGNASLSGSSAFTVSSGAVLGLNGFSASIGSLAGTGTVENGHASNTASLTVGGDNTSTTFSGVIQNGAAAAMGLTKSGSGTLTLASNSNTYTGATQISAGTLQITGTMAASAYTIDSGATLDLAAGSAINSGAVTFSGSGTLKLANNLIFGGTADTGDKTVSMSAGGLIWVTGSSTIQASSSQRGEWATNQASLQVDAGSAMNFFEAGSTLVDQGIGVDALTGSGTVTAGWNTPRTLFIGGAGGSGTFSGILANTSTSRLMAITKQGAGRQVLSGANTYTGATTIAGGTLQVGAGGTAGSIHSTSGVTVNSAATLAFNRTDDYGGAFTKAIGGAGTLRVLSGSLTLSGSNTHSGAAIIAEGARLALASGATLPSAQIRVGTTPGSTAAFDVTALAAPLELASGQTLSGYGTVAGALTFGEGSILSPGGSVGTLTGTAGTTTWNSGFIYQFEINETAGAPGGTGDPLIGWDLFQTSGTLTLAAGSGIGDQIVIDLTSLAGSGTGSAANFDENNNYAWRFAVAGSEITTFNAAWFRVETGNFLNLPSNPERFSVALGGVTSFAGTDNQALYVVYAAVPEPGALALAGIGFAVTMVAYRRRIRSTRAIRGVVR